MLLNVVKRVQYSRVTTSASLHNLSLHDPAFIRYDNKNFLKAIPSSPDSISQYIAALPKRYNAVWVEKIVAGLGTTLPVAESQQILRAAISDSNEKVDKENFGGKTVILMYQSIVLQNLKHLRGVLTAAGKGKLTFEAVCVHCTFWGVRFYLIMIFVSSTLSQKYFN